MTEPAYKRYAKQYQLLKKQLQNVEDPNYEVDPTTCPEYMTVNVSKKEAADFINNLDKKSLWFSKNNKISYIINTIRDQLVIKSKQRAPHVELLSQKDMDRLRKLSPDEQKRARRNVVRNFRKQVRDINILEKHRWKPSDVEPKNAFEVELFGKKTSMLPKARYGKQDAHITIFYEKNYVGKDIKSVKDVKEVVNQILCTDEIV